MEDIVAVRVSSGKKKYYFLTWGRIFGRVDPTQLLTIIRPHLATFDIDDQDARLELCESLKEASSEKYFYECFFLMSQKKIPFGKNYLNWQKKIGKVLKAGREIYFLGKS